MTEKGFILKEKKLRYLKSNLFFKNVPEDVIRQLDTSCFEPMNFRVGDLIIKQDTRADYIYLIAEGRVKISKTLETGKEVDIVYRERNDFVGELALLKDSHRSANVFSENDTLLLGINKYYFYKIFETVPGVKANIARAIADRLVESDNIIINEASRYELLFDLNKQVFLQKKELEKLNRELQLKNEELYRISITDRLTTIYNRGYVMDLLSREFTKSKRHDIDLACILIDIDDFKEFNDQYGHLVGDFVLLKAAKLMLSQLRNEDVLGRYGGEEFLIVLPYTGLDEAMVVAEKVLNTIRTTTFNIENYDLGVTISAGVTDLKASKPQNIDRFINSADQALLVAKRNGKDRAEKYII